MAGAKLKVGGKCKGKYGPHDIVTEEDLELGMCKACRRAACMAHRKIAIAKDPKYNTKMSRAYRVKKNKTDPGWETRRHKEWFNKNPIAYIANQMTSSLRRADRMKGRTTDTSVTAQSVGELLASCIGKPCKASISCGGAVINFAPKTEPGSPSLDHINPAQKITTMDNLNIICFECNFSKSDLTLAQAKAVVSYIEKGSKCSAQQQNES